MNYKQKSGYMLLGAGLLAIGIIIGRLIETRMEAQSVGVFEKISCREFELVERHRQQSNWLMERRQIKRTELLR